ncbi:MAG: M15 family metallopeptidase [Lachnospiraceae bacterium]|nr:M15 family metallopeptidase [Lachnospiraceae bacterium]
MKKRRKRKPVYRSNAPILILCLSLILVLSILCLVFIRREQAADSARIVGTVPTTAVSETSVSGNTSGSPDAAGTAVTSDASPASDPAAAAAVSTLTPTPADTNQTGGSAASASENDWALLLVNTSHPVPDGYTVDLLELSNGRKIDRRIYPSLQAMFDAARSEGLSLFVREGYRTTEDQQKLYDERIQRYLDEGKSQEEAEKLTRDYVALPGTSEHELGLAVDINSDSSEEGTQALYAWLYEHSDEYGFVKRYAEDKIDITGISNEPWHYRYVGVEAAKEMKSKNLCLEEYTELKS